jgi:signal transduction histidine kinase
VALPLGIAWFTFLVTAISVGLGTAITLIGIPILIGTLFAWRWLASLERRLIGALTGVQIEDPYRPEPRDAGWSRRVSTRLGDPATWKDLVFLLLQLPLGIVSFTVAAVVLTLAASWIAAPAWYWSVPDGIELGITQVDSLGEALLLVPLGLAVAFVGIPALGQLGRLYGLLAKLLLGSNPDPELTAQVTELESARSRIIAAADAERRRIERDLHDGAQQRLVALSLTLRMAETRAEKGDPEAAELIRSAGEEAGLALNELRDLARGIHPAILTNRGLAAALDDLAARAAVPVEVTAAPQERLPDQVEAAAYFVVSECLANVDKHAQASGATVSVRPEDGRLGVEVADDGTGGADTEDGSGIQGLRDRVGALGGRLEIESPYAAGTRVRATIPLAVPADVDELAEPRRPLVFADEEAEKRQARRTGRLRVRLGIVLSVAAILVLIWWLTGTDKPWIVWPLLGLGLVAGLDAWRVLGGRPLRESDVVAVGGDRTEAIRSLRRRRRLRIDAGALAVVNLFLIGIWIASGAGYFWPIWPMLGSAIALGLKSLRWTDLARERLVGDASVR